MKALAVIAAVMLLAWLGWYLAAPKIVPSDQTERANHSPPTATINDNATVFQKAFWKRPTANDKILHAERREWADDAGVQKWQWFIAVQPSPELVKHLREDNAFNLVSATTSAPIQGMPAWFSVQADATDVLQSPQGSMRLIFSKTDNVLYATDSGGGFRPGAPESPKPLPGTVAAGRLPLTPPPNPSKP